MAQLDEQFVGPLNEETLGAVMREALGEPDGSGPLLEPRPFFSTGGPVISTRFGCTEGAGWDAYVADGGYLAAKKALSMTPSQVIDEVSRANLRGLGGAGFPTARKWSFIPKGSAKRSIWWSTPTRGAGTFKDRYISSGILMRCWKA